ncbi:MAG: NAD(P)/FAD-dependent oxidoreductase [Halioglobus sp.]
MNSYDTIVIGAGHNGLICAAYLARQGQRVLVLEASAAPGGLASTREFYPGFKASVAHTVSHFSPRIIKDLDLQSHGYHRAVAPMPTIGLNLDGEHIVIAEDGVSGVSDDDASSYLEYRAAMQKFARALEPFWMKTMPRIGNNTPGELLTFGQLGLRLRRLGKEDMLEFLRVATLPMRDLMDEYFDNKHLQAALSWDGLVGSKLAPRSPNSAVFALLYRMLGDHDGGHAIPDTGIEGLVNALVSAANAAGAKVRLNAPVANVSISQSESGLRAVGVELADGEKVTAARVVSSADPQRTFLQLVGAKFLEIEFANRIQRLRCEGYVAKLHLALSDAPSFTGLDRADGRMIIASEPDALEFAFDDAKYGNASVAPVMELVIPSFQSSSMAPNGQHVLSANVMYVPASPKGGWTETARAALLARLLETLERHAPGIGELVLHAELLTPKDLESLHYVTGGHWHHTEFAVDQLLMMRPTYEAAQYETPIPGLYLCGAGSHPGGGLMGGAGFNAAREILK